MYENYSFVLHWRDLDEELREGKIDDFIITGYENGEYNDEKGEPKLPLEQTINNTQNRKDAERVIEAHFPIYF